MFYLITSSSSFSFNYSIVIVIIIIIIFCFVLQNLLQLLLLLCVGFACFTVQLFQLLPFPALPCPSLITRINCVERERGVGYHFKCCPVLHMWRMRNKVAP